VQSFWDLRRLVATGDSVKAKFAIGKIVKIEGRMNKLVLKAIPKLTMDTFGDTVGSMVDWVSEGGPTDISDGVLLRAISLFTFLSQFMAAFGGLSQYADEFLDLAATSLAVDPTTVLGQQLLAPVLATLQACFRLDQDGFWSSARRFQTITSPLLQLLPKVALVPAAKHSLTDDAVATIALLANATASEQRRTTINKASVLYMQDDEPRIRYAGVQIQMRLLEVCEEAWLVFLPQLLPYISALQEDDDERVEDLTRRWIAKLGELKGENIASMLE
jgi:U3 small nucleolar RNA-associated protein 10